MRSIRLSRQISTFMIHLLVSIVNYLYNATAGSHVWPTSKNGTDYVMLCLLSHCKQKRFSHHRYLVLDTSWQSNGILQRALLWTSTVCWLLMTTLSSSCMKQETTFSFHPNHIHSNTTISKDSKTNIPIRTLLKLRWERSNAMAGSRVWPTSKNGTDTCWSVISNCQKDSTRSRDEDLNSKCIWNHQQLHLSKVQTW